MRACDFHQQLPCRCDVDLQGGQPAMDIGGDDDCHEVVAMAVDAGFQTSLSCALVNIVFDSLGLDTADPSRVFCLGIVASPDARCSLA